MYNSVLSLPHNFANDAIRGNCINLKWFYFSICLCPGTFLPGNTAWIINKYLAIIYYLKNTSKAMESGSLPI